MWPVDIVLMLETGWVDEWCWRYEWILLGSQEVQKVKPRITKWWNFGFFKYRKFVECNACKIDSSAAFTVLWMT